MQEVAAAGTVAASEDGVDRTLRALQPYRTLVAAGVGGMCGVIVGFPFDTVKTKMQTYGFADMSQCARHTMQTEGVRGFFRGILPPLAMVTVLKGISFQTFEWGKQALSGGPVSGHSATAVVMGAGALSGVLAAFVNCPFDLVKINMQLARLRAATEKVAAPTSSFDTAVRVFRARGLKGLYIGLHALVARDGVGTAVYFGVYEGQYRLLGMDRKTAPSLVHMAAGGVAGMSAWLVTFPVDLLKSRVQKDALSERPAHKGLLDCARHLYSQAGLRGFYRGLQPTLVRAFPIHAVNFLVYERALHLIDSA